MITHVNSSLPEVYFVIYSWLVMEGILILTEVSSSLKIWSLKKRLSFIKITVTRQLDRMSLDTHLNIVLPTGMKKQRANFRKLAQKLLCRLFWTP